MTSYAMDGYDYVLQPQNRLNLIYSVLQLPVTHTTTTTVTE